MEKLTKTEENVLAWMETAGGIKHYDLYQRAGYSSFETVFRMLDTMIRKGAVERRGDTFHVTFDGQSLLAVTRTEMLKKQIEEQNAQRGKTPTAQ